MKGGIGNASQAFWLGSRCPDPLAHRYSVVFGQDHISIFAFYTRVSIAIRWPSVLYSTRQQSTITDDPTSRSSPNDAMGGPILRRANKSDTPAVITITVRRWNR